MDMRKKIAAGNWKMNLDLEEAQKLTSEVAAMVEDEYIGQAEVILAPPFPFLVPVHRLVSDVSNIHVAAQNLHEQEAGAYTGEVSASMIKSSGASHCILGHSERRQYFGEDNALLASKIDQALANDLTVIYCLGETLEERESGVTAEVVGRQLAEGCFHLDANAWNHLIIAYEPIWAIGTGLTATPEQAQEVHHYLRIKLATQYGDAVAQATPILYGGSVKPANAGVLFSQPDIDGGLVGGASLKARDFVEIIKAL